jgi:hypothetical protein
LISSGIYIAGWLNSSIHEFFEASAPAFSGGDFALITSIDSNTDLASLSGGAPELMPLLAEARPLGRGLLLPAKRLLEIDSRDQVFFGFDEVWFFPDQRVQPKPESLWLVGPARVDQMTLNKLADWMKANACLLALGDGEGLNFIAKARGVVRHLLGHSNSQPPPSPGADLVFEQEPSGEVSQ